MKMQQARTWIILLGILTPYLARLPGTITHGYSWLDSMLGESLLSALIPGLVSVVAWGAAVIGTYVYKYPATAWFPGIMMLASSAWLHASIDFSADSQTWLTVIMVPFLTLPFTATGWIIGWVAERLKSASS